MQDSGHNRVIILMGAALVGMMVYLASRGSGVSSNTSGSEPFQNIRGGVGTLETTDAIKGIQVICTQMQVTLSDVSSKLDAITLFSNSSRNAGAGSVENSPEITQVVKDLQNVVQLLRDTTTTTPSPPPPPSSPPPSAAPSCPPATAPASDAGDSGTLPFLKLKIPVTNAKSTGLTRAAANNRSPPFAEFAVQKTPSGIFLLVPTGESTYADGNNAQERIYNKLYGSYCVGGASAAAAAAPLVVDVGGLLGDFAFKAGHAGCRAICFEPQPPFSELIRAGITLNGLEGNVAVVNAAIGEAHGSKLYYYPGNNGGTAGFHPTPLASGDNHIVVNSFRLDQSIDVAEDILLMKIDVEGFDVAAVKSADALLRAGRVRHLFFEYTVFWTSPGQGNWLEVLQYLASFPTPPRLFALHRTDGPCYGPVVSSQFEEFHQNHLARHLQTDIYATWDPAFDPQCDGPWTAGVFAR